MSGPAILLSLSKAACLTPSENWEVSVKTPHLLLKSAWTVTGILSALALLLASSHAQDMAKKPMPQNVVDNRQIISLTEAEQAAVAADMRQMLRQRARCL